MHATQLSVHRSCRLHSCRRCVAVRAEQKRKASDRDGHRKVGDRFSVPSSLVKPTFPTQDTEASPVVAPTGSPQTVYTIRICTGISRGASLDDLNSGVQVCLMGANGQAMLHRIAQIEGDSCSTDTMEAICRIVGPDSGASCDIPGQSAPGSRPDRRPPSPFLKRRFQQGSVDEVSIVGPDLGPLSAILVGTEAGSWQLDEVAVTNSRENLTQRFMCRDWVGREGDAGAAHMTPLPPGTVLYGSGDQAVLMTQDQADSMRLLGLEQYGELKERLLSTTALLVASGDVLAFLAGGPEAAEAFAVGGCASFVYQALLNRRVEGIPLESVYNGARVGGPDPLGQQALDASKDTWLRSALSGQTYRLAIACGAVLASVLCLQLWDGDLTDTERLAHEQSAFWTSLLGFTMYRIAVVAVSIAPQEPAENKRLNSFDHFK